MNIAIVRGKLLLLVSTESADAEYAVQSPLNRDTKCNKDPDALE